MTSFAECFRRGFGDQVLTRSGTVSIFAGALHNSEFGREMIGDRDLRTASELTSFFAMHQYGAVIESPVYQIELVGSGSTASREDYIGGLERLIEDKNCVILGSADVNPLTELVLGRVYGIPEKYWFTDQEYARRPGHWVVTVKQVPKGEVKVRGTSSRFIVAKRPGQDANQTECARHLTKDLGPHKDVPDPGCCYPSIRPCGGRRMSWNVIGSSAVMRYKRLRACAARSLLVGGPVDGFVTTADSWAAAAVSKREALSWNASRIQG